MLHWIQSHGFEVLVGYLIFNCVVSPMPPPCAQSSSFYAWFYGVSHNVLQLAAGNINRVFSINSYPISAGEPKCEVPEEKPRT
jgi:hypothetical protein